jgi:hypothetical protein
MLNILIQFILIVFTLDEYNARRAAARSNADAFGEVQVRSVTADFAGLKSKVDSDEDYLVLGSTKQSKSKQQKTKSVVLDVAFTVAPPETPRERREDRGDRGGRGRGDRPGRGGDRPARGGDRGRGGRGAGRGGSSRSGPRVDFSDASAFPSL